MRRAVALGLCALLFAGIAVQPAPARADTPDAALKRARDRYEYGDYADAARLITKLLAEGGLTSDAQLVEANRVLGLCYFYLGKKEEARSAFVRLLSIEPDYRLDPFFHPPKVVEFFDKVKSDNEALLAPIRAQKKKVAEEKARQEAARKRLLAEEAKRREELAKASASKTPPLVVDRVVAKHDYLINWLPFGAGQFQNGQTLKGGILAGAEAVTGLASIVGFITVANLSTCTTVPVPKGDLGDPTQSRVQCGIPTDSVGLARTMDRVKWVAGGLFWGLVVYGIVDAHIYFHDTTVISETHHVASGDTGPPAPAATTTPGASQPSSDLAPTFEVAPFFGPTGGGALLTVRF